MEDQQLAMALLVELAIQRGTLSAMLSVIRLLLTVSSDVDVNRDNRLCTVLTHAPLVPVLRRFHMLASKASVDSSVEEVFSYFFRVRHCHFVMLFVICIFAQYPWCLLMDFHESVVVIVS